MARRKDDIRLMTCNSSCSGDCAQPDFHDIPISDWTELAIIPPYTTCINRSGRARTTTYSLHFLAKTARKGGIGTWTPWARGQPSFLFSC
jgi:hypothetical protein